MHGIPRLLRRHIVPILASVLAVVLPGGRTWPEEQTGVSFAADLQYLRTLTPRREGSGQEARALEYVGSRLASSGLGLRVISYADTGSTHSYSKGIEVLVPGLHPDTLLIVTPMDQAQGREGGAAGIALAIRTALRLGSLSLPVSVRVVFLGAEHGEEAVYPLGTHRYLQAFLPNGAAAVLYLDLADVPTRVSVVAGSTGLDSPRWLVRSLTAALARERIGYRLRGSLLQLNRLGLATPHGPLGAYLAHGYPAIALVDREAPASTSGFHRVADPGTEDWVQAFDRAVDRVLEDLAGGIPKEWDRHYLTLQAGPRTLVIPERLYIALLVTLVAVCVLYAAFSGGRGKRYAGAFVRGSWTVPIHAALVLLFALAPTMLIEALLAAVGFPTLWRGAPVELGILKALLATSLFALLTPLLTRTAIRRSHSFYASAAIVTQSLALIVVGLYRVTLAVYFAWGLALIFLSTLARRRVLKAFLFVLAPMGLLWTVAELFWLGEMELVRWVLLDRIGGSVLVTGAILPHYFMILRLRLLVPVRRHRLRRVVIAALGALLLIASTGVAAWVAYERPYRGGISRPLTARAVVDYATGRALLLLDCPISIGRAVVRSTGGLTTVDTRARQASLEIAPPPLPLTLSTESTQFLNRRNVRLTLGPREEGSPWPYRLRLRLEAEREFVLFDSSFPFQRSPEGTTYDISVGAGPPRPLEIGLTLPPDRGLTLVVDALYLSLPQDMSVQAEGAIVDPGLEIRVSFPFTT